MQGEHRSTFRANTLCRISSVEGVGPHPTKESDLIRRRSRTSSDEGVGPHPTKESDLIRRRRRTSSDEGVGPHTTKDLRSKRRGSPCILALPVMDLAVLKKMTFLRYCIQHANWSHFGKIYWNWETWKENLMEREIREQTCIFTLSETQNCVYYFWTVYCWILQLNFTI
jgi:hypothetical protein